MRNKKKQITNTLSTSYITLKHSNIVFYSDFDFIHHEEKTSTIFDIALSKSLLNFRKTIFILLLFHNNQIYVLTRFSFIDPDFVDDIGNYNR